MIVALFKIYVIDLIRLLFLLIMHTKGTLYLTLYFVFSALLKHQKYKYVILRNPNVNNFFAKRYPLVSPTGYTLPLHNLKLLHQALGKSQ